MCLQNKEIKRTKLSFEIKLALCVEKLIPPIPEQDANKRRSRSHESRSFSPKRISS
ncbi:hypothetical protein SAM19_04586 [Brevibacillus laterosporus]|nr:hypothetical protein [Brevibacillus laterosporus]